ncbi:MAG TPA: tyrosine-type recombinase/integrase [Elusimicrobiales bacterium]|nr:tyrosine-type recombinase/integrase [Elusimicrobiales bacterium]
MLRLKDSPKAKAIKPAAPVSELRELADRYLGWLVATRYAEATVQGHTADISWLLRYLERNGIARIADVTPETLENYSLWLRKLRNARRPDRKISPAHVSHRLATAKQFFGWLTKQMIILVDPSENLEVPRLPATLPQTILTQKEAQRLLDAPNLKSPVGYRDKALLEVLYSTGIRAGELFRLKVDDFDYRNRTLFVKEGKGGKDRVLPLPMIAAGYLKEYVDRVRPKFAKAGKRDEGILFIGYTGSPLTLTRLAELFSRTTRAAGIDKRVTAMVLRHSIASHLLENGMDIRYIQEFMGHERLSTTQVYSKVTLDGLRKMYNKHHPKEYRNRGLATANLNGSRSNSL